MKPLEKPTLLKICDQMAAHPWGESELAELVEPRLGIITGFQDLLSELEALRRIDLGDLPPAQGILSSPVARE